MTLIVVVVVVGIVVVLVGVAAAVYFFSGQLSGPTGTGPRVIGINEARSSDGTNWILTFTSVPRDLSPSSTMLTILTASGGTALSATPLPYLNGTAGVTYIPAQPGGPVQVGDRILIGTAMYPAGDSYQITDAMTTFAYGPLQ